MDDEVICFVFEVESYCVFDVEKCGLVELVNKVEGLIYMIERFL